MRGGPQAGETVIGGGPAPPVGQSIDSPLSPAGRRGVAAGSERDFTALVAAAAGVVVFVRPARIAAPGGRPARGCPPGRGATASGAFVHAPAHPAAAHTPVLTGVEELEALDDDLVLR